MPPGVALSSRRATAADAAVLLLNAVVGAVGSGVQLPPVGSQPRIDDFRDVVKLIDAMKSGDIKVLLIHDSNPLYSLPADAGFADALAKVDFVVSTASLPDETSQAAHLVLPDHSAIESWGDAQPRPGVRSVVQPTLRPLYDTQALGDTLLATARATRGGGAGVPGGSFRGVVEAAFAAEGLNWNEALAHGGVFDVQRFDAQLPVSASVERLEFTEPHFEGDGSHVLLPVPSTLLSDGRGASLSWLQETPDPVTKIAWQSWAEISSRSAEQLGVGPGDVISIETTYGTLELPVWPRGGIRDDVVAVATGQGHTVGRYASLAQDGTSGGARGVNVNDALPALTDESGGRAWLTSRARLRATGEHRRLPFTQGTDNKRGRLLGESISLAALASGHNPFEANEGLPASGAHGASNGDASGHAGAHHEGPHEMRRHYDPADDSTDEDPYRWGMTIDVDRCTGCSACVVACAVENNIPQLGEESVIRNRQMSWLRIERYVGTGFRELETGRPGPKNHEELGNTDVRNSPMLCQQCGAAPCEPVCPVLAT
ncbi:MAG: molybdopterin dinucleotide binding domain-containing protein, partial [Myxococcota bacterium]